MSKETLEYHWGKHYAAYINKLNVLIEGTKLEGLDKLEDVVQLSSGAIYNNAAQAWNHQFFFGALSPEAKHSPEGKLYDSLIRDFGSFEDFVASFKEASMGLFGSGWVWLVSDEEGKLSIVSTQNAGNPAAEDGLRPLMVIDIWEHAYYIGHRNLRADYIENFMQLLDWSTIEQRY